MIEQLQGELARRSLSAVTVVALGGLVAAGCAPGEVHEEQIELVAESVATSSMPAEVAAETALFTGGLISMQAIEIPEVIPPKVPKPKPTPTPSAHPRPVKGGPASSLPKGCHPTTIGRLSCIMKGPAPTAIVARVENGKIMDLTVGRTGDTATKVVTAEGHRTIYRKEEKHQVSETPAERTARRLAHKDPPIMQWSAFFDKSGQAFHYSSNFHDVWWNGRSEGCLNLRDLTFAHQFYDWAQIGDPVEIVPKSIRINAKALRAFNPDDPQVDDFDFNN